MIKLEPYFHIGWNELIKEVSEETGFTFDEVENALCYWLNIDDPHMYGVTQLVHTCYEELLEYGDSCCTAIVDVIQRDNVNVLAVGDVFCIEI